MGNAEVLEQGKEPVRYWCAGACGSLAAVAFSPDGRQLAYQGTRGLPEWRTGLGGVISVVELATRTPVELEAVASIPQVTFSADGRQLYAMNVTQVDDRQSFGARVVQNPRGWEIGSHAIEVNEPGRADRLFEGLGSRLRVNLTHRDIVDPASLAGTRLENLAASERCAVQALAVDDHVRAVQFHPEITGAICKAYLLARRHLVEDVGELLAGAGDSADGVAVLRNFRKHFVRA